jgi:hypothetical protein
LFSAFTIIFFIGLIKSSVLEFNIVCAWTVFCWSYKCCASRWNCYFRFSFSTVMFFPLIFLPLRHLNNSFKFSNLLKLYRHVLKLIFRDIKYHKNCQSYTKTEIYAFQFLAKIL